MKTAAPHTAADDRAFDTAWTVSDIQWNRDLDPKLFDTTPPAGFVESKPPVDDAPQTPDPPIREKALKTSD